MYKSKFLTLNRELEEACLSAGLEWEKFLEWPERGGKPSPCQFRDFITQLHKSGQYATQRGLWRFKSAFPAEVISHEA